MTEDAATVDVAVVDVAVVDVAVVDVAIQPVRGADRNVNTEVGRNTGKINKYRVVDCEDFRANVLESALNVEFSQGYRLHSIFERYLILEKF